MSHRFGELWSVQFGDRDEVRLVVSGDFYHTLYGDNVLTAHVEAADMAQALTAFAVDVGEGRAAMVDRISTVAAVRLKSKVGDLPEEQLAAVRSMIATTFGIA
ncbi:type II toxin-antitoxin system PemK/MazF family toxin [Nonomuraea zeae]|uniref:Type II toxin-antitoxin system PemK/MazF family toxin n=1 Tax=Nonomuraea zeae TaxID=1642303 RepID=A0A5S4FYN9_9ACTN|nr:type II toxin-antitoxin system PemK/MazF family toxin [Nonomuraea zeae]TMR25702.1 type II toxin-antitoxin system PemK/MazF family toxin [Nonomuraea zeae]